MFNTLQQFVGFCYFVGLTVKELRKRTSRQVLSNVTFLYPLKTSALRFVDVSSGYGNKALVTNSINVSIVQVAPPPV